MTAVSKFAGVGTSMVPAVLPGSTLSIDIDPARRRSIRIGDIVCYPTGARVAAHRVVGVHGDALSVRGDAQYTVETITTDAVVGVVIHVGHPALSYETSSPLGREIARASVEASPQWRKLGTVFKRVLRIRGNATMLALRAVAKTQSLAERSLRYSEQFFGGVALSAVGPAELSRLTFGSYGDRGPHYKRTGLTPWETRWLENDLPPAPAHILIGGAGTGREARALIERGYTVTAFEPVAIFIESAKDIAGHPACFGFHRASYEHLLANHPSARSIIEGGPYDALLLGWGSYTHLVTAKDRAGLLKLARTLTTGPVLASFFLDHGARSSSGRTHALGRAIGRRIGSGRTPSPGDKWTSMLGYYYVYTTEEIESMATSAGYDVTWNPGAETTSSYPHVTLRPKPE